MALDYWTVATELPEGKTFSRLPVNLQETHSCPELVKNTKMWTKVMPCGGAWRRIVHLCVCVCAFRGNRSEQVTTLWNVTMPTRQGRTFEIRLFFLILKIDGVQGKWGEMCVSDGLNQNDLQGSAPLLSLLSGIHTGSCSAWRYKWFRRSFILVSHSNSRLACLVDACVCARALIT